jgi:dethiobiotin synthetase
MAAAMSARTIFVAGAHTEIGKTHVATMLLRAARASGLVTDVLKPVVSDFDPVNWADSDPGRLLAAAGMPLTAGALDRISPWRFCAPLAPPAAARLEGRPLPFSDVAEFVVGRLAESPADLMVVEGVGGLMSPIADGATSLDLMRVAGGQSVLVVGSYLGAISHGLTALEVLRADNRAPVAVVASQRGAPEEPDFDGMLTLLAEHLGGVPLVAVRHGEKEGAALILDQLLHAS